MLFWKNSWAFLSAPEKQEKPFEKLNAACSVVEYSNISPLLYRLHI